MVDPVTSFLVCPTPWGLPLELSGAPLHIFIHPVVCSDRWSDGSDLMGQGDLFTGSGNLTEMHTTPLTYQHDREEKRQI